MAFENAMFDDVRPAMIATTRFMIRTDWRRDDIPGLRWLKIDLDRRTARLDDARTGFSMRLCETVPVFPATAPSSKG